LIFYFAEIVPRFLSVIYFFQYSETFAGY